MPSAVARAAAAVATASQRTARGEIDTPAIVASAFQAYLRILCGLTWTAKATNEQRKHRRTVFAYVHPGGAEGTRTLTPTRRAATSGPAPTASSNEAETTRSLRHVSRRTERQPTKPNPVH